MNPSIAIGMIGYKFMGKAHSNAYRQISQFFDLPLKPRLKTICGREKPKVETMAQRWGWENAVDDWRARHRRSGNPHRRYLLAQQYPSRYRHRRLRSRQNRRLREAAGHERPRSRTDGRRRAQERPDQYRLVQLPARARHRLRPPVDRRRPHRPRLPLPRALSAGLDHGSVSVPLLWRMDKDVAGSGVTGDLHSHIVDHFELSLRRYRIGGGHEPASSSTSASAPRAAAARSRSKTLPSSCAKYTDGAIGHFEATRFANGRKNG